ncbi:hypothetical protein [Viridibacterium curvum]|uniref:hypothetical protein n=1 Tax=Viridibacterium curvum TaxID=1101404 RepID=UPI0031EC0F08
MPNFKNFAWLVALLCCLTGCASNALRFPKSSPVCIDIDTKDTLWTAIVTPEIIQRISLRIEKYVVQYLADESISTAVGDRCKATDVKLTIALPTVESSVRSKIGVFANSSYNSYEIRPLVTLRAPDGSVLWTDSHGFDNESLDNVASSIASRAASRVSKHYRSK